MTSKSSPQALNSHDRASRAWITINLRNGTRVPIRTDSPVAILAGESISNDDIKNKLDLFFHSNNSLAPEIRSSSICRLTLATSQNALIFVFFDYSPNEYKSKFVICNASDCDMFNPDHEVYLSINDSPNIHLPSGSVFTLPISREPLVVQCSVSGILHTIKVTEMVHFVFMAEISRPTASFAELAASHKSPQLAWLNLDALSSDLDYMELDEDTEIKSRLHRSSSAPQLSCADGEWASWGSTDADDFECTLSEKMNDLQL